MSDIAAVFKAILAQNPSLAPQGLALPSVQFGPTGGTPGGIMPIPANPQAARLQDFQSILASLGMPQPRDFQGTANLLRSPAVGR